MSLLIKNWPEENESYDDYYSRLSKELRTTRGAAEARLKRFLKKHGYKQSVKGLESMLDQVVKDKNIANSTKQKVEGEVMTFLYEGPRRITSEQDIEDYYDINLNKWEPTAVEANSWEVHMKVRLAIDEKGNLVLPGQIPKGKITMIDDIARRTNHQCKVKYRRKEESKTEKIQRYYKRLNKAFESYTSKPIPNAKKGESLILNLSDIHTGSKVSNLPLLPDFNVDVIIDKFRVIAKQVKGYKPKNVVLNILGDIIESFTGLNHIGTWKELDVHGFRAVQCFFELLEEHLLSQLPIKEVNIVSGNHDRTTSDNKLDYEGEGAYMLYYLIRRLHKNITCNYDPLVLTRRHDGVTYILMHGHLGLAKQDVSKLVLEYGTQGDYNVFLHGHEHKRATSRTLKKVLKKYEDIEVVGYDSANYRKIIVPPIFTGNFYQNSLGYSGFSGVAVCFANGRGSIDHHDISL